MQGHVEIHGSSGSMTGAAGSHTSSSSIVVSPNTANGFKSVAGDRTVNTRAINSKVDINRMVHDNIKS
jgi:hypothetical protein